MCFLLWYTGEAGSSNEDEKKIVQVPVSIFFYKNYRLEYKLKES